MLGEFAGVVPILNILLSVVIAIITVIALHKHAAQLQSKFASAEEFSAKRVRVIVAAVAMSAIHFLTMGAFIVLEELTANPDLLTYAAIMGAAVTSIFTPLAFWVMFHFANEIDTIINPGGVLETSNDEEPLLE
ncbi:hypothetical protein HDU99_009555 [Rhizoclosmatium hyalinum]|nr:hypothetical protein HDU99_009555 [Rhizoclosmatium hyalinum]